MGTEYEGWSGEFYVNCAQVNIIGPGGGQFKPEDFARFPGAYLREDPSMAYMLRMIKMSLIDMQNFSSYDVWRL